MAAKTRREALQLVMTTTLLGLSGCTSDDQEAKQTSTDSRSPEMSETLASTESPVPKSQITEYSSLNDKAQKLFEKIITEGPIERASDKIPSKLWEADYIQYEGDIFELKKEDTGSNVVEYTLITSSVDESDVNQSETVTYSKLSNEAQTAFQEALSTGEYRSRAEPLPGKLDEAGFVKYDGAYYELKVAIADIRLWKLSAQHV